MNVDNVLWLKIGFKYSLPISENGNITLLKSNSRISSKEQTIKNSVENKEFSAFNSFLSVCVRCTLTCMVFPIFFGELRIFFFRVLHTRRTFLYFLVPRILPPPPVISRVVFTRFSFNTRSGAPSKTAGGYAFCYPFSVHCDFGFRVQPR